MMKVFLFTLTLFVASVLTSTAQARGFKLYHNGKLEGHMPAATYETAVTFCKLNLEKYGMQVVRCTFDDNLIGAALVRDELAMLDPLFKGAYAYSTEEDRAKVIQVCKRAEELDPNTRIYCVLKGKMIGYSLYRDNKEVGHELMWDHSRAIQNCKWNYDTYPRKLVECWFDGEKIGYDLTVNDIQTTKFGFSPKEAVEDCEWNRKKYGNENVFCRYLGHDMGLRVDSDFSADSLLWAPTVASRDEAIRLCKETVADSSMPGLSCSWWGTDLGYILKEKINAVESNIVTYAPHFTVEQAEADCKWAMERGAASNTHYSCTFNGVSLP